MAGLMTARKPTVDLPSQVGPCRIEAFGAKWAAVRCPDDLKLLMRQSGGLWEPGTRRWLIERRRLVMLVRELRRVTDTLFRQGGVSLDREE